VKQHWTIRTQLFVLLLATITPLLLFVAYNIKQQRDLARENALHDTLIHARIISARVDNHLENIDSVLRSASALIVRDLSAIKINDEKLRALYSGLPAYVRDIWVMTPDGKPINSIKVPPEDRGKFNFSDRKYFQDGLTRKELVIDDPILSRISGKHILVASRPIIGDNGSVLAVIALSTELEIFREIFVTRVLAPGAVTTLLNQDCLILARSVDPQKWICSNLGGNPVFNLSQAAREYSTESVSADGVLRISGLVTTRLLGWVVYVGIPTQVALAQSTADLRRLFAIVLFALFAATLLALLFARRITRPIDAIVASVRKVVDGKTDTRIAVTGTGTTEIANVAGQFNHMLDSLDQANRLLSGQKAILEGISAGRSLPESLDAICRLIEQESSDMLCSILLLDADGVHVRHGAAPSLPEEYARALDGSAIGPVAGSCGTAAYRREQVIVEDIATDPLWVDYRHLALPHGLRACWSTPIFDEHQHLLGTFAIYYRQPRGPDAEHKRLIELATHTAAIAISTHRASGNLLTIEERFLLVSRATNDAIWDWDFTQSTVWWNEGFTSLFGYPRELLEPGPESWTLRIHPDDLHRVESGIHAVIGGTEQNWEDEYRFRRHDGTYADIYDRGFVSRDASGKAVRMIGAMQDISERKQAEEKIKRLSRVHTVLSGINTLIVRERNRQQLLNEACRIAVEDGGFGKAWIGLYDPATLDVTPLAWSGFEPDEEWAKLKPTARDVPEGQGSVGRAIRSRKVVVVNNLTLDASFKSTRRATAVELGFRSVITLPLFVDGEVAGVFLLLAREIDFFDAREVKLLTELAGDISFALEYLGKVEQANYLSYYDVVTGLPNRTLYLERLSQTIHAADDASGKIAVVLGDIQRFRMINETLGRQAGDEVLKRVAGKLQEISHYPENLARITADCFASTIPTVTNPADVAHRLEQLATQALQNPITVDGQELTLAFTLGVAMYPDDGADAETLLRNAEAALKKAKVTGEKCCFYKPEINARVAETLVLEHKLRRALDLDQFVLHYQPKVDVRTRTVTGLEALIRWQDPDAGLVPPIKFIALLEETGLILEAGEWALWRAIADHKKWGQQGLHPPRIAVNVSSIQLRQHNFVDTVKNAIEAFHGAGIMLDLEITESVIMENFQDVAQKLQAVRDMGVRVALDDFGTGYSSLSYIARLPIHSLKIDRSFIIEMDSNTHSKNIVTMIIQLAHTLGLEVIAEGVDNESQVSILSALGCDQMQGYLMSKPLPSADIEQLLIKSPRS